MVSVQLTHAFAQQWEYALFMIYESQVTAEAIDNLNTWGTAGWEAVGVTNHHTDGNSFAMTILLKRPR